MKYLGSELVTDHAERSIPRYRAKGWGASSTLREVFCPSCRRHYTMYKPPGPWAAAVVHVVCEDCHGNGVPQNFDVPR